MISRLRQQKRPSIAAGPPRLEYCAELLRLLDRREQPVAAMRAREGPHLGRLLRRIRAVGGFAGGAIDVAVLKRIAHRDAGVLLVTLAPCLCEIALQQLNVA